MKLHNWLSALRMPRRKSKYSPHRRGTTSPQAVDFGRIRQVERFEERLLLTVTPSFDQTSGLLEIGLDSEGDAVTVSVVGSSIDVFDGTTHTQFAQTDVRSISAEGDDSLGQSITFNGTVTLAGLLSADKIESATLTGVYTVGGLVSLAGTTIVLGNSSMIMATGDITFDAKQIAIADLANLSPVSVSTKTASIQIGDNAVLSGHSVTLTAEASDASFTDTLGSGQVLTNFVIQPLIDKGVDLLAMPIKVLAKSSTASVTLNPGVTITAIDAVSISATAVTDSSGVAASRLFSVGYAQANSTATIDVAGTINAGGAVNLTSDASSTASISTETSKDLGDVSGDPSKQGAVSLAISNAVVTSKTTIASTATIHAGDTVNIQSLGTHESEAEAESGLFSSGKAALSLAFQFSTDDVKTVVDGIVKADVANRSSNPDNPDLPDYQPDFRAEAAIDATDSASASAGLESAEPTNPDEDTSGFDWNSSIFDSAFDKLTNHTSNKGTATDDNFGAKSNMSGDAISSDSNSGSATPGGEKLGAPSTLSVAGALAFSYTDHKAVTQIGIDSNLKSKGDMALVATINEQLQMSAESTNEPQEQDQQGNPQFKPGASAENTASVAVIVGIENNKAQTVIDSGAALDASGALSLNSSVTYPYLTKPDELVPTSVSGLVDKLKDEGYDGVNDYLDGTLGLTSNLFNTWARSTATADSLAIAGSVDLMIYHNVAESIVHSGVDINQDPAYRNDMQSVSIDANNDMQFIDVTGVFNFQFPSGALDPTNPANSNFDPKLDVSPVGSSGERGGFGGAIHLSFLNNTTHAIVEQGVNLHTGTDSSGGLEVHAEEAISTFAFTQAGGSGGKYGIGGSLGYTQQNSDILAQIENGARITGGAVDVHAGNIETQINWVGGVAKSEALGVGAAIAANNITRDARAVIGNLDLVDHPTGAPTVIDVSGDVTVTAKIDGALWAFTVAGAVVSKPPMAADGSGMTNEAPAAPEDPLDGESLPTLFDENPPDQPEQPNVPQKTDAAKTGVGIAGAIAINQTTDTVQAAVVHSQIASDNVTVKAENDVLITAATGGLAFSANSDASKSAGLAGAFSKNDLTATTSAFVNTSEVTVDGNTGVVIQATRGGNLIAIGLGGALASATNKEGEQTAPGKSAFSIAGSVGLNTLSGTTEALVSSSTVTINAPATGDAGGLLIKATDSSEILTIGGGVSLSLAQGGASGSGMAASVGVALAVNKITSTVNAKIDSSTVSVNSTGDVKINAEAKGKIKAFTLGAAVAAASGTSGGGIAGAGSGSVNLIHNSVAATVSGDSSVTTTSGDVTLTATDTTEIEANAGGFALALSKSTSGQAASLAVGGSFAVNKIDSTVNADIDDSDLTSGGDVKLTATGAATISALTLAGAASAGLGSGTGMSFSGAGAGAVNKTRTNTRARIRNGARATANSGSVKVTAKDRSTIKSDGGSVGLALSRSGSGSSVAGAVGASLAFNDISNTTEAAVDQATVSAMTLDVSASSQATIDVKTFGLAGSLAAGSGSGFSFAGAGAFSGNDIDNTIEAAVRGTSTVTATTGDLKVETLDDSLITADTGAVAVAISASSGNSAAIAVGVTIAENTIDNTVLATVDASQLTATLGNVEITATEAATITTTAAAATVSIGAGTGNGAAVSGGGAVAINVILTDTNSSVVNSTVTAGGNVELDAESTSEIDATVVSVAVAARVGSSNSVSAAIGAAVARNFIGFTSDGIKDSSVTQAYFSNSSVTAGGDLTATAIADQSIESLVLAGSVAIAGGKVGLGAAGSGVEATNKIGADVKAYIAGDGASGISADSVSLTANDSSSISAIAGAASLAASFGSSVGGSLAIGISLARNEISNDVFAYIQDADQGVTTTTGDVTITSTALGQVPVVLDLTASNFTAADLDDAAQADPDNSDTPGTNEGVTDADDDAVILNRVRDAFAANGIVLPDTDTVSSGSKFTTADGSQSLEIGDTVRLTTDYTGGGVAESVYRFRGPAGTADLGVENYADANRWTKVPPLRISTVTEGKAWVVVAGDGQSYLLSLDPDDSNLVSVRQATINVVAAAASLALGFGSTTGIALSGAGADSSNVINSKSNAFIESSKVTSAADVKLDASSNSTIVATVAAVSVSVAGGSTAGVGASIGAAVAKNYIGWNLDDTQSSAQVQACVLNSSITAAEDLTQTAIADQSIDSLVLAGSAAVGVGGTAGVGLSGSGVLSENKIGVDVKSFIDGDGATGIHADDVTLSAEDTSTISTFAGAASLAASLGGTVGFSGSIGVALARNTISTSVASYIANADGAAANPNDFGVTTTVGAIVLTADESAEIRATAAAASLAAGFGGTGGIALSGAGADATNVILTTTNAHIDNSVLNSFEDVVLVASNASSIIAEVIAASASVAVGGVAGFGASIGAARARNFIGFELDGTPSPAEVQAYVLNSSIIAGGDLSQTATANETITAQVLSGSVAVSGGGAVGVGLSGAGSSTENKIATQIRAFINGDGATGIIADKVSLTAMDTSSITTTAGSASLAGAFGGVAGVAVSVGVGLAHNEISNTIEASIQNADQGVATRLGGDISLQAIENATITATALAASAAAGGGLFGAGLSGAGADAVNVILTNTSAVVLNSKLVSGKDVNVKAEDHSTINATVEALSAAVAGGLVAGAVSIGLSHARNLIGVDLENPDVIAGVHAYSQDSSIDASGAVRVTATAEETIDAQVVAGSVAVAVGLVSGAASGVGSITENFIAPVVEAFIDGSGVTGIKAGSVTVTADDTSHINAIAGAAGLSAAVGFDAGAVSVGVSSALNQISSQVIADIRNANNVTTTNNGAITVHATERATIDARSVAASFSLGVGLASVAISGAGADATNVILTETTASVQDSVLVSAGAVDLDASDTSILTATIAAASDAVAGGLVGVSAAIGSSQARNLIGINLNGSDGSAVVQAFVKDSSITAAGALTIDAIANETITATVVADSKAVAGGLVAVGVSGGLVNAENKIAADVEAYIDGDGLIGISAGSVSLNASDTSTITAFAGAAGTSTGAGLVALSGSVGISQALNTISNAVDAYIINANNKVQSTTGNIQVQAVAQSTINATSVAAANATSGGLVGAAFAGAGADAANVILTETSAFVQDSVLVSAAEVDLDASDTSTLTATIAAAPKADAGGLVGVSAAIGTSQARNLIGTKLDGSDGSAVVQAFVKDSSITATGALTIDAIAEATITAEVVADSRAVSGGLIAVAGSNAFVSSFNSIAHSVQAFIDGDGADGITTGSLQIQASDTSTITATAGAASLAKADGIVADSDARGDAIARNTISNQVAAYITHVNDGVTAIAGDLQINAVERAMITATSTAASAAESSGLFSGSTSGGGATAFNENTNSVRAFVEGASIINASAGTIEVTALHEAGVRSTIGTNSKASGLISSATGISSGVGNIDSNVEASILGASQVTGGNIRVTATSELGANLLLVSDSNGTFAGAGGSANATINNVVHAKTGESVRLNATDDITFLSRSNPRATVMIDGGATGLASGTFFSGTVNLAKNETFSELGNNNHVTAGDTLRLDAFNQGYLATNVVNNLGLSGIADVQVRGTTLVGSSNTKARIGDGSMVTAETVEIVANDGSATLAFSANSFTSSETIQAAGNATATSITNAILTSSAEIGQNTVIVAPSAIRLSSRQDNVKTSAKSLAKIAAGLTGNLTSNADNQLDANSNITTGSGSSLTTETLDVQAESPYQADGYILAADTDAETIVNYITEVIGEACSFLVSFFTFGLLDGDEVCEPLTRLIRQVLGSDTTANSTGHDTRDSLIDFNSNVVLISPVLNPTLSVDALGNILATGVTYLVQTDRIVVDDIINPSQAHARLRTPAGTIKGQMTIALKDVFQTVVITNASSKDLELHDLEVANPQKTAPQDVEFVARVKTEFVVNGAPVIDLKLSPDFSATSVTIANTGSGDIQLNGTLDNPGGTTSITNSLGDVLTTANPTVSTRSLLVRADQGSIGTSGLPLQIQLNRTADQRPEFSLIAATDVFANVVGLVADTNSEYLADATNITGGRTVQVNLGQVTTQSLSSNIADLHLTSKAATLLTSVDGAAATGNQHELKGNDTFDPMTLGVSIFNPTAGRETFNTDDGIRSFSHTAISNNIITLGTHHFINGQAVVFSQNGGDAITNLTDGATYFVVQKTDTTLKLTSTEGGTALEISGGTGTAYRLTSIDVIHLSTDHSWKQNQSVVFRNHNSTAAAGLTDNKTYYVQVINGDARNIRLSTSPDGSAAILKLLSGGVDLVLSPVGSFTFNPATSVNSNTVQFTTPHGFVTGQPLYYTSGSDTPIGGLSNNHVYYAVVDSATPSQLKLAATRDKAVATQPVVIALNATPATGTAHRLSSDEIIEFSANHLFQTGEAVTYAPMSGDSVVGGLTSGNQYFAVFVDATHILLASSSANAVSAVPVPITLDRSSATGTTQRIAARDTLEFATSHGFSTGTPVVYHAGGGAAIGGLTDGATYFAISVSSKQLKLADTAAHATSGTAMSLNLTQASGMAHQLTGAFTPSATTVDATAKTINLGFAHGLEAGDAVVYENGDGTSITGLMDNGTYYVIPVNATTVALAASQADAIRASRAVSVNVVKADRNGSGPIVEVADDLVTITLDTNAAATTTVAQLVDLINNTVPAAALISATAEEDVDTTLARNANLSASTTSLRLTSSGKAAEIGFRTTSAQVGVQTVSGTYSVQIGGVGTGDLRITSAKNDLILTGELDYSAGTVEISTSGTITSAGADQLILAQTVNLTASNGTSGTIGTATLPIRTNLTAGRLDALADGDIFVTEVSGDLGIGAVTSTLGNVTLVADASILDALDDSNADVSGSNITLTASHGKIGASTNSLEIDSSTSEAGVASASAQNDIFVTESTGPLHLGLFTSTSGTLFLSAAAGAIDDDDNNGVADLVAANAVLSATAGIGTGQNPIDTTLDFTEAASGGDVILNNSKALGIGAVSTALAGIQANGNVELQAVGTISNTEPIVTTNGGVVLDSADDVSLGSFVTATAAIVLRADDDVLAPKAGTLTSATGGIQVIADDDGLAGGTINLAGAISTGTGAMSAQLSDPDGVISSVVSGSGGFVMNGPGTLTLTKINTYTGPTILYDGRFDVNGSTAAGSSLLVGYDSVLGGRGTVNGSVTVFDGGTVAPGTSAGVLKTGNVNLKSGSTFEVEIGGTSPGDLATNHDQLNVTGTVSLGNAMLSLSAFNGFVPKLGDRFTIIANDDDVPTDPVTGTFNGLPEASVITNFLGTPGVNAVITYKGGTGNDVLLEVIPALVINDVSAVEGNNGTTALTFTVTLANGVSSGFTVDYETQDEIATVADNDYVSSPPSSLRIGSFNGARGGDFSLSDGASAAATRSLIQSTFPATPRFLGAQFTGTSTLTPAFLATVDVVWLNSVFNNTTATVPLSSVEQTALLDFVKTGGRAIIFGESDAFDDESLLSPFNATTTGTLVGLQTGTITNHSDVLTNGPNGVVSTLQGNFTSTFSELGAATPLGTWGNAGTSVAVIEPSAIAPHSGRVLLLSDVNFYADQLGAADNSKLLLNALSAMVTNPHLTFEGTTGESHTITVLINGDTKNEADETLRVVLSNVQGNGDVILFKTEGLGGILNDDATNGTPPVITSNGGNTSATVYVAENSKAVTTIKAFDIDSPVNTLTYSISGGADAAKFSLAAATQALTFKAAPDFENPSDADHDNVYEVLVSVADSNGNMDTQALSVAVTDVQSTLSINDVSQPELNSGLSNFTFAVTLGRAVSPFSVRYGVQDGTATVANHDYAGTAPGTLRIGAFDASRGGIYSLSDGAKAAAMKSQISSSFPGATITGTGTLTTAFLSTVDVVWLNGVSSDTASTTALTAAEQAALLAFVQQGGHALLFGENGAFDDESLFDPFNATTSGTLTELQTGTITNTTHALTQGPFGTVKTLQGNYPGNLSELGAAIALGKWNSGNGTNVAVLDPGVISADSGRVVLLSDVNFYADQLDNADNKKLLLNALAAMVPPTSVSLSFEGTEDETQLIHVSVQGDSAVEGDETFRVLLGQLSGTNDVKIVKGKGVGTILNDDGGVHRPVITSDLGGDTGTKSVSENSTTVTTVTATDVDLPNDALTFGISGGADAAKFSIVPATGVLTFKTAPDFENPGDSDHNNLYEVTVTVTDSIGQVDSQALSVTVFDVQASLSIGNAQATEGSPLAFQVTLSNAIGTGFTVNYASQDGTDSNAATVAGQDYVPVTTRNLRIGAFDGIRGGIFSLSNGSNAAAMRTLITSSFSGATFVGLSTLTPDSLKGVDVVWLNSVSSNSTATAALTTAEQDALLAFVQNGGHAMIFGENSAFDDESLLDKFSATTTGTLSEIQLGTITDTSLTNPLTHGSFGTVATLQGNYSGSFNSSNGGLGLAKELATWNSGGPTSVAVAVIEPHGVLGTNSGRVVLFSDVNFYSDQLSAADNSKLLLNALATMLPPAPLAFTGTQSMPESRSITVTTNTDALAEGDETLKVLLGTLSGTNDVTITQAAGLGTIHNGASSQHNVSSVSEDAVSVVINDVLLREGNSGSFKAVFTVQLSQVSDETVTVSYATVNATATSGVDYKAANGTLTFAPGQTTKTFTILVTGDKLAEATEFFDVHFESSANADLVRDTAQVTIVDNDPIPSLSINSVSVKERTGSGADAVFTVKLSKASGAPVTVHYASLNGTAVAGSDFDQTSGTLTFAPGQTTQTVKVHVTGDALHEANETFQVRLSGATNATIRTSTGKGTIKNDDKAPSLSIGDVTVVEGNIAVFTVILSAPSGQDVTVKYATANGSAKANQDYTAASGSLIFAAGETTKTVSVNVGSTIAGKANKQFAVNLSAPLNAVFADRHALATILDNL